MTQNKDRQDEKLGQSKPEGVVRVRLPGFIVEEEPIGLGDVIKRATYAIGFKSCSGCEQRAATLNRWISFHR